MQRIYGTTQTLANRVISVHLVEYLTKSLGCIS